VKVPWKALMQEEDNKNIILGWPCPLSKKEEENIKMK
jgi:hypothetical protein